MYLYMKRVLGLLMQEVHQWLKGLLQSIDSNFSHDGTLVSLVVYTSSDDLYVAVCFTVGLCVIS